MRFFDKLFGSLFFNKRFKNSAEFDRKYTAISLQRGWLFKWVVVLVSILGLCLDLTLNGDSGVNTLYRRSLFYMHLAALALAFLYILVYGALKRSERYGFSKLSKAVILSDVFMTLLAGALLSLNSQRFTGNIDAYTLVVFAVALVVPTYPKWVVGLYGLVHLFFLIALSVLYRGNAVAVAQFNATTAVSVALVLFIVLYNYNVNNFLSEERLKEGKATFARLFETNPFPLMISNFEDGRILYANQKALSYYALREEQLSELNHKDLFVNASDVDILQEMLHTNGAVNNYVADQKTHSGGIKRAVVNYEPIDYFGEKSVLIGVADIAQIKRMERELSIHASTDVLTGIFNRRVGMELIKKRYETVKREGKGFVLCFIDLDNLKMVNDRYGHLEGDSFIIHACGIIKEEVDPKDIVFRYGGDEFMIVFRDDDEQTASRTCRRLADRFEALNESSDKPYPINASMGLFSYKPEMDLSLEQIIEIVDKNMYSNKLAKK